MYQRIDLRAIGARELPKVLEENLRILLREDKSRQTAIDLMFLEISGGIKNFLRASQGTASGGQLLHLYFDFYEKNKQFASAKYKNNVAFRLAELSLTLAQNNHSKTVRNGSLKKIKVLLEDMDEKTREILLDEVREFKDRLGEKASDPQWEGVFALIGDVPAPSESASGQGIVL